VAGNNSLAGNKLPPALPVVCDRQKISPKIIGLENPGRWHMACFNTPVRKNPPEICSAVKFVLR
jgi:hypothetical protein